MDELAQRLQAALGDAYAVEKELGKGGFAVVYLVRDVNLKRKLAIKVLSPDVISSKSVLERFKREAETVAQLQHPNIVPLHFIGEKDGLLYLAMQCIEGGSLSDRMASAPNKQLPIDDTVRVLSEVGSALAYAHKRGVIHRDVKPQNVLLDADSGRCLVTDFGIARTADSASLTATGMVMGTPTYLAPEQVTGEPSDHRADIYALGVMGYEMLAGRAPFEGANPTAVMMKRLAGPPEPIRKVRSEVPEELELVLDVALAPDVAQRFQNAGDLVRSLSGASPVSGAHTTTEMMRARRKKSRKSAIVVGVVAGVLALAAAIVVPMMSKGGAARKPQVDYLMQLIPAGTYTIGSNDPAAALARPAHSVTLPAFGIDVHEVTVEAYKEYVDSTKSPPPWGAKAPDAALPVTGVLWQEASNYCRWRHPDGGYLPSEEEWEAAARGASGREWPWGAQFDPAAANITTARRDGPARVGSFPRGATPEGIQDMIGNVWEWTASVPKPYPGSTEKTSGADTLRVIRGGAATSPPSVATVWRRVSYPLTTPRDQLQLTGFRCAMPARAP